MSSWNPYNNVHSLPPMTEAERLAWYRAVDAPNGDPQSPIYLLERRMAASSVETVKFYLVELVGLGKRLVSLHDESCPWCKDLMDQFTELVQRDDYPTQADLSFGPGYVTVETQGADLLWAAPIS